MFTGKWLWRILQSSGGHEHDAENEGIGIVNRDCEMDIRRMFLIRYIGPLNSKRNSSASCSVTPLPLF